ncbi:threonine ammonia-lyase, biosynthetic [Gilvimarinus sp. F26214L]|uniref:threonine ammonia-lyase, biosynthetic n=1 Tax=Gilvimarinus sp. DZF01 TaxID=3461371 RepID=UPI0040466854
MSHSPQSYFTRILDARIYDLAVETPLDAAPLLSHRLSNDVLLKREDLQPVFSFKIRGAYNKLLQLSEEERRAGVVAASAGNHAQGLALAARHLGVAAVIVMPRTTPQIKVDGVRRHGGKVVQVGDTYDEAFAHSQKLVTQKGLTYIHPFDDPDVIAGQGTVAVEVLKQCTGPIHAVFIPVGGGGLCAGMAAYIKHIRPETKVIAVEADDSACLKLAMEKKRRAVLPEVGLFADGVAVAQIGKETFTVLRETVDQVITANSDEMCAAIKDIFEDTRSIAEPAGALALAGMKKYVEESGCTGETLVAVVSGANTNFDRLRYISERTEVGEKREAILAVTLPERPGAYKKFCRDLGKRNITEFNYRYADKRAALVFVGVQVTHNHLDREELVGSLQKKGYSVEDLTDNEMAKLHIRYMVGGRAPDLENEVVYRFEFPERPGALLKFLTRLASGWNISMFHYRNHGAAYGRVLVGLQVPPGDRRKISQYMDELGYNYWEESDNPAYRLFLS